MAASCAAQSATNASNSSAGTTRLTIPIRSASSAEICSPSSSSSLVFLRADVAVDQRHDHEREDANIDLGRAEAHALARDDQVARQRQPERTGEHVPVGRAQRRLAELADQAEQAREALDPLVLVGERHVGGEAREVAAAREHLLVRGGEHDAADRIVVTRGLERTEQFVEQFVRQRVARVRLIQCDRSPHRFLKFRTGSCRRPSRRGSLRHLVRFVIRMRANSRRCALEARLRRTSSEEGL